MLAVDDDPPLSRARVEALATDPTAHDLSAIEAAVAVADYEDACARAIARVCAGRPLPASTMAQVVPGLDAVGFMVHTIALSSGDRPAALMELVEECRFRDSWFGHDQSVVALCAAWRLGDRDALRHRVAMQLRLVSRRKPSPAGSALLLVLAHEVVGSDEASTVLSQRSIDVRDAIHMAKMIAEELVAPLPRVLAQLDVFGTGGRRVVRVTTRGGQRPCRNDLCPCGSGAKFKRCCVGRVGEGRASAPTGVIGWDRFAAEHAGEVTIEHVDQLTLRELARLDLAGLSDPVLLEVASQFTRFRRWDLATRCLQIAGDRPHFPAGPLREGRIITAVFALRAGQLDVARAQLAALPDPAMFPQGHVAVAIADRSAKAIDLLLHVADAVAKEPRGSEARMLAAMLLLVAPGLGLLVTRGCLGDDEEPDPLLRDTLVEARIRLNLPLEEPSARPVPAPAPAPAPAGGGRVDDPEASGGSASQDDGLREAFRAARARAKDLERTLQERDAELAVARTQLAVLSMPTPPPEPGMTEAERRALRERIAILEARIREKNEELAQLRRQLAEATGTSPRSEVPVARTIEDDGSDDGPPLIDESIERPVRLSRFADRAAEAVRHVPRHVAALAVRTVGALATGERLAWRGVKEARGMPSQVLMARVGIHYRLLFSADQDELLVLDLVTRENLQTTLKLMRTA